MAIITTNVQYDGQRPIRESIKATGLVVVNTAHTLANTSALANDIVILARETLKESIIEASIESKKAELAGMDQLAELEAQLANKRAQLTKAKA